MLSWDDAPPSRRSLQDFALEIVRTLDGSAAPWRSRLEGILRQVMALEVSLADLALSEALAHTQLTDAQQALLYNAGNWQYEPRIEIQCVRNDDGPGVQFSFAQEVAVTSCGRQLLTGRYWVGRNGRRDRFDDRQSAISAADHFLNGPGRAFGVQLQQEFQRRLQECMTAIQVV